MSTLGKQWRWSDEAKRNHRGGMPHSDGTPARATAEVRAATHADLRDVVAEIAREIIRDELRELIRSEIRAELSAERMHALLESDGE